MPESGPVEDLAPAAPAPDDLLDRAFANLYAEDYIQTMSLTTHPRGGRGMTRLIQIARRQSVRPGKALVRFLEPYQVRRTSVLVLENEGASDDLYIYLPATGLTRHLSTAQRADSFFGTDLSYEDIEPKRAADYRAELLGAESVNATPCSLLDIRPREGITSTYERMVSCIDPERAIILRTDFYRRGTAIKRLETDLPSVRDIAGRAIPFTMTMTDLRRLSRTSIITESYDIHPEIPDSLFTTWNLEAGDAGRDRGRVGRGR